MSCSTLIERFQSQASFAAASKSLLYQRLFTIVRNWLEDQPDDHISKWLEDVHTKRSALEVSLLLMAGIHREVLLNSKETEQLREYYPSTGGTKPSTDINLPKIFLDTTKELMAKASLRDFLLKANVQTNETGRGVFWLLPVAICGWKEIHLADLGASAGLNLVADQRKYTFVDKYDGEWSIGQSATRQFAIHSEPNIPAALKDSVPHVLSRSGCDLFPFDLKTEEDKATLTSFIFADQIHRIERLQEGIGAFKRAEEQSPVVLAKINLPDELPLFLASLGDKREAPTVLYNTFMTAYLRDEGRDLLTHIDDWARQREYPVLWAQLEPPSDGKEPPDHYWCAWSIHLWENGQAYHRWQIGWVHPHGTTVKWLEDDLQSLKEHFN